MPHRPATLTKARWKVREWPLTLVCAALVLILGWVSQGESIQLPLSNESVPSSSLVVLATTCVLLPPLVGRFGMLEATFVRSAGCRVCRLVCAALLCAVTTGPALSGAVNPREGAAFLLALMTVGLVSLLILGELAWLPTLGLGMGSLLLDTGRTPPPIGEAMAIVGPIPLGVFALAAGLAYVVKGPRISAH